MRNVLINREFFVCVVEHRFGPYFVSPVIAGLDPDSSEPYLAGMDTIGAIETAKDFMVAGTAPDSLYGMCESMWRPNMARTRRPLWAALLSLALLCVSKDSSLAEGTCTLVCLSNLAG